jgi:DNA-binding MarR family transcriptional regulator
MAKPGKGSALIRLQSAARLSRTALAARLLAHGFYAGQDQVMIALENEDGQSPGQLAGRLGVKPPTITKTINRLQSQGFLEKRASEIDARQAHVYLTEAGRNAIKAIEKSVRKTEKQAMKGLDKKEQKALSKLLSRIESNLSGLVEPEEDDDLAEVVHPIAVQETVAGEE